jgi:hypothetical protein
LGEEVHGDVGAQGRQLVALQVVDHAVGDLDRLAGGRDAEELAGVGADEVGLQRRLAVGDDQGLDLGVGVKGLGVSPRARKASRYERMVSAVASTVIYAS